MKIKSFTIVALFIYCTLIATAQDQIIILGAGQNIENFKVKASSFEPNCNPENTINGKGLDGKFMEASRFLSQAGFGGKKHEVEEVLRLGFEKWIDEQTKMPNEPMSAIVDEIMKDILAARKAEGFNTENYDGPKSVHFNYSWWTRLLRNKDVLRIKMAQALSEIFVISVNSDIDLWGKETAHYYDILLKHAFGNYEILLNEIALNPLMGFYLSHYNNPKADSSRNIHPDENFARELMQLFTIGLYELNIDGTEKMDSLGNPIPTYNNSDIRELARVFTGLGMGAVDKKFKADIPTRNFGLHFFVADKIEPMAMYQNYHDTGIKKLLNGKVLPANQNGIKDIQDAINNLFNHPNMGPFLALRLIQRFVKSNPSPQYIERVAKVFNNNGKGQRGDLLAVIKAILLDHEVRSAEGMLNINNGMLRPPLYRIAHLIKATDQKLYVEGRYWHHGFDIAWHLGHHPLAAPSVFNFYPPDHIPPGPLAAEELYSPELKIHNTTTAINYMNKIFLMTRWGHAWWSLERQWDQTIQNDKVDRLVEMDFDYYMNFSNNVESLINELDRVFTHGQLTDETRQIIRDNINGMNWEGNEEAQYYLRFFRARMAIYLFMISPDYAIFK